MPYAREHREKTRARIIDSARALFNRHGFAQVSIDAIMEGAGLTRGGFYHHFDSKDELYAEAVRTFRGCSPFAKRLAVTGPLPALPTARLLVDLYLSDAVLENPALHCPLYALASDVTRAGDGPRGAYDELMRGILGVFRAALREQAIDAREAESRALNMLTLCVGGMVLARTTPDTELARSLREASRVRAHALLADEPTAKPRRARKVSGAR